MKFLLRVLRAGVHARPGERRPQPGIHRMQGRAWRRPARPCIEARMQCRALSLWIWPTGIGSLPCPIHRAGFGAYEVGTPRVNSPLRREHALQSMHKELLQSREIGPVLELGPLDQPRWVGTVSRTHVLQTCSWPIRWLVARMAREIRRSRSPAPRKASRGFRTILPFYIRESRMPVLCRKSPDCT